MGKANLDRFERAQFGLWKLSDSWWEKKKNIQLVVTLEFMMVIYAYTNHE